MGLLLLQAPSEAPVSLDQAKLHLRIDGTAEDDNVTRLIKAATRNAEKITQRAFVTQRWALILDRFPDCRQPIKLPLPPLQTVEAIKYFDASGVEQTLDPADYAVDPTTLIGRVLPAYSKSWPATRCQPMAVRIEFTAGYGAAASVEPDIVSALLLMIGHLDQNREAAMDKALAELPLGVSYLLSPYVVPSTP